MSLLPTILALGPAVIAVAIVVWLVERLPVIGIRWIEFRERRHGFAKKKRKWRRKKKRQRSHRST
ncbi:MAG TPA: hypothetical protein VGO24_01325 [Solirubrobacterales bacterium]|jgi:uncharacterized protein involved in cysteine biosynthesis|nr:hypothetical protein [Solirubrobacterales bacterium]